MSPAHFQLIDATLGPEVVDGAFVADNFFEALGLRPAIGRLIGPQPDALGSAAAAVCVISWSYWRSPLQSRSRGAGRVAGRQRCIHHDRRGDAAWVLRTSARHGSAVVAAGCPGAGDSETEPLGRQRRWQDFSLVGRLKPGVTIEQAQAEMRVLDRARLADLEARSHDVQWRRRPNGGWAGWRRSLRSARAFWQFAAADDGRRSACCCSWRAQRREHAAGSRRGSSSRNGRARGVGGGPIPYRAAGADGIAAAVDVGWRVRRPGGLCWRARSRRSSSRPADRRSACLNRFRSPSISICACCSSLRERASSTGLLFGLAPAWNAFVSAPSSSLRDIGGAAETRRWRRFGQGLVVAQVALSVILLSAAALFVRHLTDLRTVGVGFQTNSVLQVRLDWSRSGYTPAQMEP